jgi:hypothetical protein
MLEPNITIKIGTEVQKDIIKQEIKSFIEIIDKIFKTWFDAVLVPEDFEQEVRKLVANDCYSARRGGIYVLGKFIKSDYGRTLVLNPFMFTESFDTQVRFHFYLHETNHYINSLNKTDFGCLSKSNQAYMENFSLFYEEYCSERFSLSICGKLFTEKTKIYLDNLTDCYQGHLDLISNSQKLFFNIRKVLNDFSSHGDGDKFLKDITPIIEPVLLSFFYILALKIVMPDIAEISLSDLSPPFNQLPSIEVANLCHESYPENLNPEKDIDIIKKFFYQFGFEFKDYPFGLLFIKIIDI